MLDKNQNLIASNNSKVAGRDLFDHSVNYLTQSIKHASAIENILMGMSKFTTDIQYEKPDTSDYTIEDKIDHNKLTKYESFFDDYMENYSLVKDKINIICEEDLTFEKRLISHVRSKYIKHYTKDILSDDLLDKVIDDLDIELKNHSDLHLEDINSVHYIVFYVFAECKIFEKPPRKI